MEWVCVEPANAVVCFFSVVILCGSQQFVHDYVLMAHQLHMTNGEYVYIVADQVPSKHVLTPWVAGDDQDETARLAFESVLQVRVAAVVIAQCPLTKTVSNTSF